ncbi:MAG TPA: NAD(P)/FAD-dependent oxidoreductase [Anaerolineae bacterium]|nr:NAD(P)/FAD-dependent oxidoreductase [Anaerolineae bacterium]
MYEVVVIGAGYGGMAIAALLARRGHRVLVCEQGKVLGGRARSDEHDGFILDWGLHVNRFGDAGPAAEVLRRLGESIEWAEEGKAERSLVQFNGRLYPRPDSVGGYLTTPMLSWPDRLRLVAILLRALRARPEDWYAVTWAHFVRRTTRSPAVLKLCQLFNYAIYAPDIEAASAGEVIYFVQRALKAPAVTAQPVGGTGQIVRKLERVICRTNEIRLGCKVDRILLDRGHAVGVLAGGEEITAQAVVFTPPVQHLFRLVPDEALPTEFWEYAANLEPTACIAYDFGLQEPVSDLSGSVINLDGAFLMGSIPSNRDPSLVPQGMQLASFLNAVAARDVTEKPVVDAETMRLRRWIAETFPGLFDRVLWERRLVIPLVDGVHLRVGQAYPDRHPIASPHIRGLFFVGDTVAAPACSADIAFNAALEAEELIEEYLQGGTANSNDR